MEARENPDHKTIVSYFVFPQAWITPAIMAAAIAFGPIKADHVKIHYAHLPGQSAGQAGANGNIYIDKRPASEWPKEKAQCVLVHEYGHLRGRKHSKKPQSIMYPILRYGPCHRWLVRHDVD